MQNFGGEHGTPKLKIKKNVNCGFVSFQAENNIYHIGNTLISRLRRFYEGMDDILSTLESITKLHII